MPILYTWSMMLFSATALLSQPFFGNFLPSSGAFFPKALLPTEEGLEGGVDSEEAKDN